MASEIRVNKIENRSGLGTVTFADTGVDLAGIVTATTFSGSGASLTNLPAANVTGTLPAISGANLTNLPAANLTGALPAISGANLTGIAATDNVRTGILDVAGISTFRNTVNIGAAVTISESGIEASGIGITCANINGTQIGGRRNKIINGGMLVSQRQTSSTDSNVFVVDRFQAQVTQMDNLVQTLEQSSDSPDGFSKSIKITTTTPETSMAANEQFRIQTKLEGQDFQDLEYGSASAKTITISFYVKASVTGTFGFTVYRNESTARVITAPYTISSADTWERKIITIPGDTAGAAITDDTSERMRLMWGLAAGGNFNTASSSWGNYSSANLLGGHVTNTLVTTDNATWQLAGVQLEVGSQATAFEHRSYADEFLSCCRYYFFTNSQHFFQARGNNSDGLVGFVETQVPLRASPSVTLTGGLRHWGIDSNSSSTTQPTVPSFRTNQKGVRVNQTGHSGVNDDCVMTVQTDGSDGQGLAFDSEL